MVQECYDSTWKEKKEKATYTRIRTSWNTQQECPKKKKHSTWEKVLQFINLWTRNWWEKDGRWHARAQSERHMTLCENTQLHGCQEGLRNLLLWHRAANFEPPLPPLDRAQHQPVNPRVFTRHEPSPPYSPQLSKECAFPPQAYPKASLQSQG
jgi:hypothetical protein